MILINNDFLRLKGFFKIQSEKSMITNPAYRNQRFFVFRHILTDDIVILTEILGILKEILGILSEILVIPTEILGILTEVFGILSEILVFQSGRRVFRSEYVSAEYFPV